MRLGGPIFQETHAPASWVAAHQAAGYRAAFCPVGPDAPDNEVAAYVKAAADADIVIAEVGAWSNPNSPKDDERRAAIEKCKRQLDLAERIGARCCVNITGSRGEIWDGPDPKNLTRETFDMIVDVTREIIDAVKPRRAAYGLETMPWMYPNSPETYDRLLKAIDREGACVHFDPVNLINSIDRYYESGKFIRECFRILGPRIRSCHAKDIRIQPALTLHLIEVQPGLGELDYNAFLSEANRLDPDLPIMMEHLATEPEYQAAGAHIRKVAEEGGMSL